MKIRNLIADLGGADRVTKARRALIASGDPTAPYADHIADLARELHPEVTHVVVTQVEDATPTARTITFEAAEGEVLPPFEAGQYCVLDVAVGPTRTSRPYSICSGPHQARAATTEGSPVTGSPYFQITVRAGKPGEGFVSSFLYTYVRPGDRFSAHLPFGRLFFEPLRDTRQVVALAGGSGITPFAAMAEEVAAGLLDIDLTIVHGSELPSDVVLGRRLAAFAEASEHVHVANVYSGPELDVLMAGEEPGYEAGLIDAEVIRRHSPADPASGDVTYFVCGPRPMYELAKAELAALGVPARRVRHEVFGAGRDVTQVPGYPAGTQPTRFSLVVRRGQREDAISALSTEPLAVAMERHRIPNHTRCRSGACGWCRCKLVSGQVFVPEEGDGRRWADKRYGYVHACSAYPLSDCVIEVPIV